MNDDDRSDRKERVLHTRVPAVLEQELKRLAEACLARSAAKGAA